ncbi:dirigent protein 15-like [Rosa rugosa]|uniref:dirigent protein 15-like n=1 Tax=Rosa rugosa TaxID=74645 RepID=UPI002B411F24|nr:dirigent protein 15-like [Rosa rugosa]
MERSRLIFGLAFTILLTIVTTPSHCKYHSKTVPVDRLKEKVTQLHFYLFDILSGTKPSAVEIARPNVTTDKSATPFGSLYAFDDHLREGPETNSSIVGNAKGLYLSASQDPANFTIVMYADFGFTTGKFKGSSFGVFSRNPVAESPEREVAVVGGRGKFRLARGFARVKTHYFNATNGDAILEYKATIIHY